MQWGTTQAAMSTHTHTHTEHGLLDSQRIDKLKRDSHLVLLYV